MDASTSLPAAPPRAEAEAQASEPVWLLLGSKQGDNSQILALAAALGLPFRRIQLRFNLLHWLLPAMLGRSLWSVRNRADLRGPPPKLVISSGLRSVPAARWVQAQSQGQSKLVHIGRPWGPFRWFDLVVTTPQYALPTLPNVHHNLLPILADERATAALSPALTASLAALPRPWTVAVLGGHSRPLRFTVDAATQLAAQLNQSSGSVLIVGSPRTPAACIEAMRPLLQVPHAIFPFGTGENPYPALRAEADRFVITGDSVQMAAELLVCGKPLKVFPLPEVPDALVRLTRAWRDAAASHRWLRPAFEWMRHRGLLSSLRDIGLFHRQLEEAGVYQLPDLARALRAAEKRVTVHHVQQLLRAAGEPAAISFNELLTASVEQAPQPALHRH
ncbi:MAG: ELM1/GtrOC1 family putative glycosyltransferase [Pseudomonadota bacterium]